MRMVHRKTGKGAWKLWMLRSPKPPGFWSQWFSVTFIITAWLGLNCWGNVGLSNHGPCGSLWLNLTWLIQAQLRLKAGQWARNYITGKRVSSVPIKVILKVGRALVCRIFRHLWVVRTSFVLLFVSQVGWLVPAVQKQLIYRPQSSKGVLSPGPGNSTQQAAPDCICVCCFEMQDLKRKLWKKWIYWLHVVFSQVFKSSSKLKASERL